MTERQQQDLVWLKCAIAEVKLGGCVFDLKVLTEAGREWRYYMEGKERVEERKAARRRKVSRVK